MKPEEVKRALDSAIDATFTKRIGTVGGRAANGVDRKRESRHVMALEG